MIRALQEEETTLTKARERVGDCREQLIAEAKRLRSYSAVLARAERLHQIHVAVDAFIAALKETTEFTARLQASIDGLLANAMASPVVIE